MDIKKTKEGSKLTLKVSGGLDTISSPELQKEIDLTDIAELVFDFENLEYISSSGIRILVTCQKIMNKQGCMKICKPNSFVNETFELTGLDRVFDIEN